MGSCWEGRGKWNGGREGGKGSSLTCWLAFHPFLSRTAKHASAFVVSFRQDGRDVLQKMGSEEADRLEAVILDGEWKGLLPLAGLFLKQPRLQIRYNLPTPFI